MRTITPTDLDAMDKLVRVQFVNSLPGIRPVSLVGTCDAEGHTNLAPFSSVIHLGSNPALLGLVSRPGTVDRHTLENIQKEGTYTLNHLHPGIVEKAHQCSARYPREVSEFDAVGLHPHHEDAFVFVKESRFRMGLRLVETLPIEANGTLLLVGSVEVIHVAENAVADDGSIDFAQLELVSSAALDSYYQSEELKRLPYAKP